jgi:hypothetical protein
LKVTNPLTKLQGVLDLCEHGDHTQNHERCKAAMRKQVRVVQAAMCSRVEVLTDTEQT